MMRGMLGGWVVGAAAMGLVALAGCGGDDMNSTGGGQGGGGGGEGGGGVKPQAYYDGAESAALGATGNQATCSTCHSNDGTQVDWSGNTFKDIAYHTSYKGGMAKDLLSAANACITGWMGGKALTGTEDSWKGLETYIQSISDKTKTTPNEIAPEVLDDEAAYEAAYAGGDAAAGAAKYTAACGRCHDGGLKVGEASALPKSALKSFTIGRLAQKARTSGPPPSGAKDAADSTPGPMPFFELKDLPQQDLKDIIAHIKG